MRKGFMARLRYLISGTPAVFSTEPILRKLTLGDLVTSPILNAAAHIRAAAVSGGAPTGIDEVVDNLDWRNLLYLTERSIYIRGASYWHIEAGRSAYDMDAALTITHYDSLIKNANGDYKASVGVSKTIPAAEVVAITSPQNPPNAATRLTDALSLEAAILKGWRASASAVVNPRYVYQQPAETPPRDTDEQKRQRDLFEGLLTTAVVPIYGEDIFAPLPAPTDTESLSKMNEVRRIVSMDSGVPAQLLGSPENAQYANLTNLFRGFYEQTVRYEVERIGSAVREQGALSDFAIDISQHFSIAQAQHELAATAVLRANALARLVSSGVGLDDALEMAGLSEVAP